jgi:hypothetical protein
MDKLTKIKQITAINGSKELWAKLLTKDNVEHEKILIQAIESVSKSWILRFKPKELFASNLDTETEQIILHLQECLVKAKLFDEIVNILNE